MTPQLTSPQPSPSGGLLGRAALCMAVSGVLFGLLGMFAKQLSAQLPMQQIAFIRIFLQLVCLTPFLWMYRVSFFGNAKGLLFARGTIGVTSMCLGFAAIPLIPLSDVVVLWKTSVLFTALLSVIFLRERPSLRLWALLGLGLLGVILIVRPSFAVWNMGGLYGLAAGFTLAVVTVSIRKLHETEHWLSIMWSFSMWGSLVVVALFGGTFVPPTKDMLPAIIGIGFTGIVGQVLYTYALKLASASWVQSFGYSEILVSFLVGVAVFGEIPSALSLLGTGVLVFSMFGILQLRGDASRRGGVG